MEHDCRKQFVIRRRQFDGDHNGFAKILYEWGTIVESNLSVGGDDSTLDSKLGLEPSLWIRPLWIRRNIVQMGHDCRKQFVIRRRRFDGDHYGFAEILYEWGTIVESNSSFGGDDSKLDSKLGLL